MLETNKGIANTVEYIAKAAAVVGGSLYVAGFLIINAYLSKFGLNDFNVINSRFVFAGASFSIACLIWWLVSGRLSTYKELIKEWDSDYFDPPNPTLSLCSCTMLLIARSITASLLIVFFMFGTGYIVLPCLFIVCATMFSEAIMSSSIRPRRKFPNLVSAYRLFSSVVVCVFFFTMLRFDNDATKVFFLMISLEVVAIPLGDAIREGKLLDFKPANSSIYLTMMIGFYMISFGLQFFDKITPKFGGGLAHRVEPILKDPITIAGVYSGVNNNIAGQLLYSNDKINLLSISNRILIVPPEQIKYSTIDTKPDPFVVYHMIKTLRRIGILINFKYPLTQPTLIHLSEGLVGQPNMLLNCFSDWKYACGIPSNLR